MLDRTIPFYNTILRCDRVTETPVTLPGGFRFSPWQPGYEDSWARLETACGDFSDEAEAKQYFSETYMTDLARLKARSVFLLSPENTVIGACLAWEDKRGNDMIPSLHWLILDENYHGKGLGRALSTETMNRFYALGAKQVYIHTQPWSYPAIFLYISQGFRLKADDTFSHYENQVPKALETLRGFLDESQMQVIMNAVDGL
ncbi:MAG: GNAT family N-acetyltransferase [Clostridia bacterium]|nr:GNAT family N-acetyltransferase [Clostridia bacterium]